MEKTEITLEYTEQTPRFGKMLLPKKEPKKPFPWKTLLQGGGFCLMGLFWGRIELMGLLRPMGLAYLSAFFGEGWLFGAVWLAVGLGAFAHAPLKTGAGLAAALAIQLTLGRFLERQEMGKKALLGTFASVLAGIFCRQPTGSGFLFCHCRCGGRADAWHQLSGAEGRGASAGAWESRDSLQRGNAFAPASGRGRSGRACVPAKPPDRRISAADGICGFSASCRKAGGDRRRCGCRCVSGVAAAAFRRCQAASFRCPRFRGNVGGLHERSGQVGLCPCNAASPLHFSVLHRYDVAEPDLDRRIDKRGAAVFPVPQGFAGKIRRSAGNGRPPRQVYKNEGADGGEASGRIRGI